jgi:hypothetical protein
MPSSTIFGGEPVRVHARTAVYTYGTWRNLFVNVYRASPSVSDLTLREPMLEAIARRYPSGFGVVTVVVREASGALPDDAARKLSERQVARWDDRLLCGALVLEGTGIEFTLLRSLLRGIAMASRRRFPYHFFGDVGAAATWMAKPLDVDAGDLQGVLRSMRAAPG